MNIVGTTWECKGQFIISKEHHENFVRIWEHENIITCEHNGNIKTCL